jgi:hypothetical protein
MKPLPQNSANSLIAKVQRYVRDMLRHHGLPPVPGRNGPSWKQFLQSHLEAFVFECKGALQVIGTAVILRAIIPVFRTRPILFNRRVRRANQRAGGIPWNHSCPSGA